MSEYTPDTRTVKYNYAYVPTDEGVDPFRAEAFDRWLEAHDREVAAKANTDLARRITSVIANYGGTDVNIINRILEILDETL